MGINDEHNLWWQDVLEHGPASSYAQYFDIDWFPPKASLHGKLLLAVLGDQFGKVLEDQQLQLAYNDQRFVVVYGGRHFPTDPKSWVPLLKAAVERLPEGMAPDAPERMELESVITALEHLPGRDDTTVERVQERHRESEVTRRRLSSLFGESQSVHAAIERVIAETNGRRGDPHSFDRLEAFLTDQAYRLCYWRVATDEINYRRFFDVDALAAIRVEDPAVFAAIHETVLRFVGQGWVNCLRIDHADGLLDPRQYLESLASAVREAKAAAGRAPEPVYTVIEKILAPDETLPSDWPISGTTGYDFLNLLNGIFVDRLGVYTLRDIYSRFAGTTEPIVQVIHQSKRTILATSLSSELYTLSNQLEKISEQHRSSRDFTHLSLYRALREIMASFPVYRTYIRPGSDQVRDEDRRRIDAAVRAAKRLNPAMSPTFFDFIASVLLLEDPEGLSEDDRQERRRFALKFQQLTGPVMAKGLEDTCFYRYYPLLSLNEVGSDPMMAGVSIEAFHRRLAEQAATWPHSMLATGTHDTKRGEDVRARLNVLSEFPREWDEAIRRWQAMNANLRHEIDGAPSPDANEEYLIYQTLVGTWPIRPLDAAADREYVDRVVHYFDKALREAKLHTSWLNPNEEYDKAVADFVRAILGDLQTPFAQELDKFARGIAAAGFVNSLAQTLTKLAAPGVPDTYQGTEFWDFNLVDPDNRRRVDFRARASALEGLKQKAERDLPKLAAELLKRWPDERLKMLVIWRALQFRRENPVLSHGDYRPLAADGARKGELCAFARTHEGRWALCLVPRLSSRCWIERPVDLAQAKGEWPLAPWWSDTIVQLPAAAPHRWRHVITGRHLEVVKAAGTEPALAAADVFRSFPVALLAGEE